jgi:hypothetical protein
VRKPWILVVFVALALGWPAGSAQASDFDAKVLPFAGLGTWVDVYDYVPGFPGDGGPPPVTLGAIDDMADLGVQTLYLQAAQDDSRITGSTVAPKLLGSYLRRAHDRGMQVVAWYVPKFYDQAPTFAASARCTTFAAAASGSTPSPSTSSGRRACRTPPPQRGAREARQARPRHRGRHRARAITLEPVLLEDVNANYWPAFPWKKLQSSFDVWLPMNYWTNRNTASGFRDGFTYTSENIKRVRNHLDEPDAARARGRWRRRPGTSRDYDGFVRAAKRRDAIGWSIYDFNTTTSAVWARLNRD